MKGTIYTSFIRAGLDTQAYLAVRTRSCPLVRCSTLPSFLKVLHCLPLGVAVGSGGAEVCLGGQLDCSRHLCACRYTLARNAAQMSHDPVHAALEGDLAMFALEMGVACLLFKYINFFGKR